VQETAATCYHFGEDIGLAYEMVYVSRVFISVARLAFSVDMAFAMSK